MRILGIDPGSRITGYGCLALNQGKAVHLEHGVFRLSKMENGENHSFERRLLTLFQKLSEAIDQLRPEVMVVEKIFMAKNALSALKLGHARGVILLLSQLKGLRLIEYSPTEVKQSLSGYGRAQKQQLAQLLGLVLGVHEFETPDASDGLALALCHANYLMGQGGWAQGWGAKSRKKEKRQSLEQSLEHCLDMREKIKKNDRGFE